MPELIHILPFLNLLIALAASIAALVSLRAAQRPKQQKLYRAIIEAIEDIESDIVRLNGQWKKLNANYASLKANGKNQYTERESDDDSGRRMDETQSAHKDRLREIARSRGLYAGTRNGGE